LNVKNQNEDSMKRHKVFYRCLLISAILLSFILLLSIYCHIDHGLEPIVSKISGKIFFKGEIPPHTDEVRVGAVKEFPPRSINELLFSDMIPFRQDTAQWEIYLSEGHYEVIAVIWKEHNASWNISDVIGLYGGEFIGDLLVPTYKSVTIPNSSTVIDTIDIEANLNRVNRDAKITGNITFLGEWPQNTGALGVGAFVDIPKKGNFLDYYFKNVALDYGIPSFINTFDYQLRVRSSDILNYIAVVWIDDSFDLTQIMDIGFYRDPQNPDQPGSITLSKNSTATDIDIIVDFSQM
jgi:hypothetical protein